MTAADDVASRPPPAIPPRPVRPLSALQLLRIAPTNSLAACDEELFAELFVERRFLWYRGFIVSDPAGIRRVLVDNCVNYPRIDQVRRIFAFGSGAGMLSAEGEEARRRRQLLNPTLDHRAIQPDIPALIELAAALADRLGGLPPGQDIDISEAITHYLTRATGHVFVGADCTADPMIHHLGQYPGKYNVCEALIPNWLRRRAGSGKSRGVARAFQPLLERLIGDRRSRDYAGAHDLMWRLVHARDVRGDAGLSDSELQDEVLTLGSTAATPLRPLSWIWYLLATHPPAEERLAAELDRVLAGRLPGPDDLPRLTYLRQVLDETMRLYPPLPVMMRVAAKDDVLCGRAIPKNAVIVIMPWVVHRHRKLWADPDRFDPDRFAPGAASSRSRYAYLPFSVGPHVCIGAPLAMAEMQIVVAVLAQRFRLRLVRGHPITPTAWTNLRPQHGIRVTVEPRGAS
jgi:cytochrome P450